MYVVFIVLLFKTYWESLLGNIITGLHHTSIYKSNILYKNQLTPIESHNQQIC